MWSNTRVLVVASFLILILGFVFLWSGLKPVSLTPSPSPIAQKQSENQEIATNSASQIDGEQAIVSRVVDGDTIELQDGKKVRLVGMDTPETVDPRRPVGCFGKEASNKTKSLLTNKKVILQKDVSDTDKYGRLLRYVFLPLDSGQTLFVNDYLVREGYAKVYTYPPDVKYNKQFLDAERQAREANKGLWGGC